MEHVPRGVFGAIHPGGGGASVFETVVMFAVIGVVFYGGVWVLVKLGDLIQLIRTKLR